MRKLLAIVALMGSFLVLPGYATADDISAKDFERGTHQGWVRG